MPDGGGGGGGSWGPEDENWPQETANVVKEWATKAANAAVNTAVDKIRDILGHPEQVMTLATTWSPDASRFLSDAKRDVESAKTELAAYWEGPAFTAFNKHMESVLKATDAAYKVMTDMSDHMLEFRKTITETYKAAINFLSECAQAILNGLRTLAQKWKDLWGGVCEAILQALSDFLTAYTKLMTTTADIITKYESQGVMLQRRASELQVPDVMPATVGEAGNWRVHKTA
jgi:uncharacterized protein YukE